MKLIDLNVLLYVINRDAPQHRKIRSWWEAALSSETTIGLSWIVLLGFIRLATNPCIFPQPLSMAEALARVDSWLAHRNTCLVTETDEHWSLYKELLSETGPAGNLTTDAHLAALAISHGAVLVTCDADFGRFRHLRCENPAE